ncbi:MAG: energy-coupling factor transporter transmembrane protein EcfT [Nitrospiraceae bacterium]|nr:energy-coupling factor transporter transmembrane protein EcfT [Nitrospiraceae bacterium]
MNILTPVARLAAYLIFSLCIFFFSSLWFHSAVSACVIAAALLTPGLKTKKGAGVIALFVLFTFAGNMFYGSGRVLFSVGSMHVTDGGISTAAVRALRVFDLIYAARILSAFTPLHDMAEALRKMLLPFGRLGLPVNDFFFTLSLTLKCLPAIKTKIQDSCRAYADDNSTRLQNGAGAAIKKAYSLGKGFLPDIIVPVFIDGVKHPEQYFSSDPGVVDSAHSQCRRIE